MDKLKQKGLMIVLAYRYSKNIKKFIISLFDNH